MKRKIIQWLSALAICLLLCGALTSCDFSEKNVNDFFNQIVGTEQPDADPDEDKNGNTSGTENQPENGNENEGGNQGNGENEDEKQEPSPFAPSIGPNGNWWIGSVDLGIHKQSTAAISIEAITLTPENTELVITYTNKTMSIIPLPTVTTPCAACTNVAVYALKCHPHTASFDTATEEWSFTPGKGLEICKACGKSRLVDNVTHVWGSLQVVAPTCAADGYTKKPCAECNYYEIVPGSETAKGKHDFAPMEGVELPAQSCTEGYWILGVCKTPGCGVGEYVFMEAKGHTVAAWQKGVAPTLTAEGILIGSCEACKSAAIQCKIPALNETDYTCVAEDVSCLKGGKATYTYITKDTKQSFSFQTEIPPSSHTVAGVLVHNLKKVDDAIVYGQAGVQIFSSAIPKCGEIVSGFFTCDVCEVHYSTQVIGDHTWGAPTYQQATCAQPGMTIRICTAYGCNGRSEEITESILSHAMTYTLSYEASTKIFRFQKSCATCETQTESQIVNPKRDEENSMPPRCNAAGYDLYVYTFTENGVKKSVSCKVENGTATGIHQLTVNGKVILPDEIAPGVFAYSSEWIGKGLFVLTASGEVEPDRETCGIVYDGFFACTCGMGYITVKIYNPHSLTLDPLHEANKAPTETENGVAVYVCNKADCDYYKTVEIEK